MTAEVVLRVEVRGQLPLDLNNLLRMSKDQRCATRRRRGFQDTQRLLMRAQNRLPSAPLEGPLRIRFCRRHMPREAVDIDNATAGLKTILDGLVDEGVLEHDGSRVLVEIDRVWQEVVRDRRLEGFLLELVR